LHSRLECFSTNLSFQTTGIDLDLHDTSPSIDYENCLSIHSPVESAQPPGPTSTPENSSSALQATWLLASMCISLEDGLYGLLMYQFTEDNRVLIGVAAFDNDSCQVRGAKNRTNGVVIFSTGYKDTLNSKAHLKLLPQRKTLPNSTHPAWLHKPHKPGLQ
jgi:hypothetical protein